MADKTYPVGTKVIFIAQPSYDRIARDDSGKTATITHIDCGSVGIFIPGSKNNQYTLERNPRRTWTVPWEDIKPIKNQQLEFSFMNEVT